MLTRKQIDKAMHRLAPGIAKYRSLRHQVLNHRRFASERSFQKAFNGFYRVRRNAVWQTSFYRLMADCKRRPRSFSTVLKKLKQSTGRCEASFASKLVATLAPNEPVIDSVVLRNLALPLPPTHHPQRLKQIDRIHRELTKRYRQFLATSDGRYLMRAFKRSHGNKDMTPIKMLDFVLWQTR